ncbi:hypothetical protein LL037_05625 [Clostridium estertheticum]|uniref:hypothetical protein n=1 Tax=Clostridium estertheticum TaxID=238834 RepID=UPI001C0BABAF|nr:hypothetical protein [Clostridium estertheticum]MBU3201074.1 hypothetical protein [Clostridium estertheticum]WAG66614.1 hypothetical protein LL037_05625 [Clostridium estertheticum]
MPFCTHEGSGLGSSEVDLKRLCPSADICKGLSIQGGNVRKSEKYIRRWLKGMNIKT